MGNMNGSVTHADIVFGRPNMKKKNPIAKELRTPKYQKRIVEDKRNKKDSQYTMKELADFLKTNGPTGKINK